MLIELRGLIPVVPFNDPPLIASQGTIGLEILSDLPDTEVLLVSLFGGGLLAGIAMTAKTINPAIRVLGLSLSQSPAMLKSVKVGQPVQVEEKKNSIADSLLGGIGENYQYTLSMVKTCVVDHLVVDEKSIKDGMFHLFDVHPTIAEGAAVIGRRSSPSFFALVVRQIWAQGAQNLKHRAPSHIKKVTKVIDFSSKGLLVGFLLEYSCCKQCIHYEEL